MKSKLTALFQNRASSPREARLEKVLLREASRIRREEETDPKDDAIALAKIMERARKRPESEQKVQPFNLAFLAPGLLGAAAFIGLLVILSPNDQTSPNKPQQAQPASGIATEELAAQDKVDPNALFSQQVKTVADPLTPLAFNPLAPMTEEWKQFAEETKANAESLLATAEAWTALPDPTPSIDAENFLPEAPDLREISPYGKELQRLRNDAINAFEALPFIPKG